MEKMCEPIILEQFEPEDMMGITGFVVIKTSHCSFHSFTKGEKIYFDIFSYKDFDKDIVIDILSEIFDPKDILIKIENRNQ